jgi:hypothetical protein
MATEHVLDLRETSSADDRFERVAAKVAETAAVASRFSATTRVCGGCRALIGDPAAPVCPRCDRVLVPHHSTWARTTKAFLLSELARRRWLPWMSEQSLWEMLLKDCMTAAGGMTQPNPRGTQYTMVTPLAELYPPTVLLAERWRALGSPLAVAPDLPRPDGIARATAPIPPRTV